MADDYLRAARARAEERDRNRGPGIDYAGVKRMFPKQKAALTRAEHTGERGSPERRRAVTLAVRKTVKEWGEPPYNGHWPDDWARWQQALDDVLGWNQHVDLRDLGDTRRRAGARRTREAKPFVHKDAASGLTFAWSGRGHTVHILRGGKEVSILSSGDFGRTNATTAEVRDHIRRYLKETDFARGELRARRPHPRTRGERLTMEQELARRRNAARAQARTAKGRFK